MREALASEPSFGWSGRMASRRRPTLAEPLATLPAVESPEAFELVPSGPAEALATTRSVAAMAIAPLATIVVTLLIAWKVEWTNGAWYWRWAWRDLPLGPAWLALAVGLVPFVAAQVLFERNARRALVALAGVTVSAFVLQLVLLGVASKPFRLDRVAKIIENPDTSSYLADAQRLARAPWTLADYPEILPKLHLHSRTKPPGILLSYSWLLSIVPEPRTAAAVAGFTIGLLAALVVPAVYWFARVLGAGVAGAFAAASLTAISPGMQLLFPMLDQCWPLLTCALVATWLRAMRRDDVRWAVAFGAVLAVMCFFTYNLLVLGITLGALSAIEIFGERERPVGRIAMHVAVALGVFAALYLALWLWTGFDPVASLGAAIANQQKMLKGILRPYPDTALFDLTEFAQGAGYLPFFLALQFLVLQRSASRSEHWDTALLFVAQILAVALTGLLPGETIRVWIFLLPLVMFPAGLELARWPARWRAVAYASSIAALSSIHTNIGFV
jgi:hypothetical protein